MPLLAELLLKLRPRISKRSRHTPERGQELAAALDAAYSAYCSGSMRSDTEVDYFLKLWMGEKYDPRLAAKSIVTIMMRDVTAAPFDHVYRQRCRFCARIVAAIEVKAQAVHEHPAYEAAIYSLNCWHPYLFKEILSKLLLGPYGRKVGNKADLFTQLAVAFDLLDYPRRAETLLRHVQTMSRTGAVRPITTDFSLRLLGVICALQGKIATSLILHTEAGPHAEMLYDLSPLQVDIAWTLALCRIAMAATTSPPRLVAISVEAWEHIAKRRLAAEDYVDIDMLMHGLELSRYRRLAALSSLMALRIAREAPPLNFNDESLAMNFVNAGNVVLINVDLAVEWNLWARHYFEELIKLVDCGEIRMSPNVQYQLAHAHAGIGYSYSNLTRTVGDDERRGLYINAKRHLDQAIGLLQQLRRDGWIESRIWAAAGRVEAAYGRIQDMHQRFASALLAGATHYELNVESLVHFFSPDDHTRLTYSEVLGDIGDTNTAILLAKAAVYRIHYSAAPSKLTADLTPEEVRGLTSAYIGTRTLAHRTLINQLTKVGRYNEGEFAYDLLKENEYNEFTRRSSTEEDVAQHVALTPFELEAIRQSGLGVAVLDGKFFDRRDATVSRLASIFAGLNGIIQGLIDSRHFFDERQFARDDIDPAKNLGKADAIVRFIASGSVLSISLSTYHEKKQLVMPIDVHMLRSLIFEFRQQCRLPASDLVSVHALGQELYHILFGPIEDAIDKEITNLYIESDRLLASIPFAALYDGYTYLIQRFSLAFLNRVALNTDAVAGADNIEHAAVFACTNLPGEELPGAAWEAEIISKQLGIRTALKLESYIDQQCTVERFLSEIVRPRGGRGLIHLATHASFDPSSDASSSLAFLDKELSVRSLRTVLEESGCDTGLFVLSACGTARQDIDVEGFSSVLLRSGVRTVLSTLWETFDDSAPEFFHYFYAHIENSSSAGSAASAARKAQLALLTLNSDNNSAFIHPAHWAPYIISTARIS